MDFNISKLIELDYKKRKIFHWDTFSLIESKEKWDNLLTEKKLEINLRDIDILGHDGILWIGFISLYRKTVNNLYTEIILPDNYDQISFIKYLGFNSLTDDLGIFFDDEAKLEAADEKYYSHDDHPYSLRKIQLVDKNNWGNVMNYSNSYITKYLVKNFDINEIGEEFYEYVKPFTATIRELILNIVLHGGNEEGTGKGLVAYTPTPPGYRIIRFCCNDIGKGFKYTLQNRRKKTWIKTDEQAIIEALLYRFYNNEDGILGLYPVLKYIRDRSGKMGIRTGSKYAEIDLSKNHYKMKFDEFYRVPTRKWLRNLINFDDYPEIPGTHIFIDLTLPKLEK